MPSSLLPPPRPGTSPRIKVGDLKERTEHTDIKTGKIKKKSVFYAYRDFQYDIDGWADSKRFLPADFDLVLMRLEREKIIPGWLSGICWNGLRLKPDDKIMFWKRREDEEKAV